MREINRRITVDRVGAITIFLLLSVNAFAQDDHRITTEMGALFSIQRSSPSSQQDPGFPQPPIGGSAFGIAGGAAIRVSDAFEVGGEISFPTRFDSVQTTGGFVVSESVIHHRDMIVSGIVRLRPQRRLADRLRFEVLGGPSVIWEDTLQQTRYAPPLSDSPPTPNGPPYGPFFPTILGGQLKTDNFGTGKTDNF
jgi:hypothetical protein